MEEVGGGGVKVIGTWPSPFVARTRIGLNIKRVKYEFLEEENFWTKSDLLVESNPVYKKFPVLIHNDRPICESMITVQYIDEVWKGGGLSSILPSDPYDRASARFLAVYIDDKLWPALLGIILTQAEEARAAALPQVFESMQLLENAFEKSSSSKLGKKTFFFGGDSVGYVDIAFGSYLGWIGAVEKILDVKFLDEEKTPLLARWSERFYSDAAVRGLIPDTDRLIVFIKVVQDRFK